MTCLEMEKGVVSQNNFGQKWTIHHYPSLSFGKDTDDKETFFPYERTPDKTTTVALEKEGPNKAPKLDA